MAVKLPSKNLQRKLLAVIFVGMPFCCENAKIFV